MTNPDQIWIRPGSRCKNHWRAKEANTQLIPTSLWVGIVGGLTLLWLLFAGIGSMLATGEAAWEDFSAETP